MVVVLLGCVGLTAGVAFGTVFSSNQSRAPVYSVPTVLPLRSCHQGWRSVYWPSDMVARPRWKHPGVRGLAPHARCLLQMPSMPVRLGSVSDSAPSGGLAIGDYVLFGFLGGLSAAVGFLVPPKSSLTAMR